MIVVKYDKTDDITAGSLDLAIRAFRAIHKPETYMPSVNYYLCFYHYVGIAPLQKGQFLSGRFGVFK